MLKGPPSEKHLSRMYAVLALLGASSSGENFPWPYGKTNESERMIALAAEMSRYDPRLFGILVEYFLKHWQKLIPQKIRKYYPQMETPQTMAVIAEFVKSATDDAETLYCMDYLQRGLKPVKPQLYYRGIYSPGGKLSQRAVEESLAQYKKWGFLAREAPTIDVYRKKTVGHLDRDSRLNILRRLFAEQKRLKLADYLRALNGNISRQQALKDISSIAKLHHSQKGRGAFWVLHKNK